VIRRIYESLPGPALGRFLVVVIGGALAVTLLLLFYEWIGSTFFDTGGAIG
jgi:hypothetical protein